MPYNHTQKKHLLVPNPYVLCLGLNYLKGNQVKQSSYLNTFDTSNMKKVQIFKNSFTRRIKKNQLYYLHLFYLFKLLQSYFIPAQFSCDVSCMHLLL